MFIFPDLIFSCFLIARLQFKRQKNLEVFRKDHKTQYNCIHAIFQEQKREIFQKIACMQVIQMYINFSESVLSALQKELRCFSAKGE